MVQVNINRIDIARLRCVDSQEMLRNQASPGWSTQRLCNRCHSPLRQSGVPGKTDPIAGRYPLSPFGDSRRQMLAGKGIAQI